mmetsp:Transcript_26088/g.31905  ORF Transcript_26088/g.31905 Transcript_26088/m.31905 type:complete len:340 (+) Transcript_26088:188-1207(+)
MGVETAVKRLKVNKIAKMNSTKGIARPWSEEEDMRLLKYVGEFLKGRRTTEIDFRKVAQEIPQRTTKQCRERYENSLAPNKRRGDWSLEETIQLVRLMAVHGQNWAKLRDSLRSRTYNGIKKKGRKFLGESMSMKGKRARMKTGAGACQKSDIFDEYKQLLELHREHRYDMRRIWTMLQTDKSEAQLERMLCKRCQCTSCMIKRREIEALMIESKETFKDAWTRVKATEKVQEILKLKDGSTVQDTKHQKSKDADEMKKSSLIIPFYQTSENQYQTFYPEPISIDTEFSLFEAQAKIEPIKLELDEPEPAMYDGGIDILSDSELSLSDSDVSDFIEDLF